MRLLSILPNSIVLYAVFGVFLFFYVIAQIETSVNKDKIIEKAISAIREFRNFLTISKDALNLVQVYRNVEWCETKPNTRGFTSEVWPIRIRQVLCAKMIGQSGLPAIVVFTSNRDDRRHDQNGNIRISNYVKGIHF